MAKPTSEKTFGLVLAEANRPATPHRLWDIPGYFVPGVPTIVGGEGEMPLEQARALADSPANDLSLVEVPATKVDDLRKRANEHFEAARHGVAKASALIASGLERAHVRDERAHVTNNSN